MIKKENDMHMGDSNNLIPKLNKTNDSVTGFEQVQDTTSLASIVPPVKQIEKLKELLIKENVNYTYLLDCNEKNLQNEKRAVHKLETEVSTLQVELSFLEENLKETNELIPKQKKLATKQEHKAKFWQCQRDDLIKQNSLLKNKVHETHADNVRVDLELEELRIKLLKATELAEEINQQKLRNIRVQNVVNGAKEDSLQMIGNALQIELNQRIDENKSLYNKNLELKRKIKTIKSKSKNLETKSKSKSTKTNDGKQTESNLPKRQ